MGPDPRQHASGPTTQRERMDSRLTMVMSDAPGPMDTYRLPDLPDGESDMLKVIIGEERKEDAPTRATLRGGAALLASQEDDAVEASSRVYLARALSENSPQLPSIASYDFRLVAHSRADPRFSPRNARSSKIQRKRRLARRHRQGGQQKLLPELSIGYNVGLLQG